MQSVCCFLLKFWVTKSSITFNRSIVPIPFLYEKKFIEYCISNNIKIESAETKEFRLEYYINDKRHYYYPDFYLPDLKIIIDVFLFILLTPYYC